jgi:hypothetical protein
VLSIPNKKTYYEILEVSINASELEIKRAFKRQARRYHPDLVATSNDLEVKAIAEEEMKRINRAKDILLDPERRAKYDSKIKRTKPEIDWSSDISVTMENGPFPSSSEPNPDLEIDWDLDEYDEEYVHIRSDPNNFYADDFDHDPSEVIQRPPPRTGDPTYRPSPPGIQSPSADSMAVEVAPGVLFLQRCLKCGQQNIEGTPYCQNCYSGLIYDNHPYFYNQGDDDGNWLNPGSPPTRPGTKPKDNQGIIIISACYRCGSQNANNSPFCLNCRSSLIYYCRPLPMDRLKNLGRNRVYTDQQIPETKGCPRCGADNEVNRKYCYSCFASMDYVKPPEQDIGQTDTGFGYNDIDHMAFGVRDDLGDNGYKPCPNCGQVNSITQDFCRKCNIRLIYDQPPITINKEVGDVKQKPVQDTDRPPIGKIDCPHCGIENSTDEVICSSCFKNLYTKDARVRNEIPKSGWRRSPAELRVRHYGYKPCPKCRCENDFRADFCRECGFEFNQF